MSGEERLPFLARTSHHRSERLGAISEPGKKKKKMEELRKLEQVQRMLQFMELRGVAIPSNGDSNRFLANLILLLVISITQT